MFNNITKNDIKKYRRVFNSDEEANNYLKEKEQRLEVLKKIANSFEGINPGVIEEIKDIQININYIYEMRKSGKSFDKVGLGSNTTYENSLKVLNKKRSNHNLLTDFEGRIIGRLLHKNDRENYQRIR